MQAAANVAFRTCPAPHAHALATRCALSIHPLGHPAADFGLHERTSVPEWRLFIIVACPAMMLMAIMMWMSMEMVVSRYLGAF